MKQYTVNITGRGTAKEILDELEQISEAVHDEGINGEFEKDISWESPTLNVQIENWIDPEINVEIMGSGALLLTKIINNQLVKMRYVDYTTEEAVERFMEHCKKIEDEV